MTSVCPDTGTYSQKYKFRCLARHVCHIIGKDARMLWLQRYAKKNGLKAMLKLKQQVEHEWPTRNQPLQESINV